MSKSSKYYDICLVWPIALAMTYTHVHYYLTMRDLCYLEFLAKPGVLSGDLEGVLIDHGISFDVVMI